MSAFPSVFDSNRSVLPFVSMNSVLPYIRCSVTSSIFYAIVATCSCFFFYHKDLYFNQAVCLEAILNLLAIKAIKAIKSNLKSASSRKTRAFEN